MKKKLPLFILITCLVSIVIILVFQHFSQPTKLPQSSKTASPTPTLTSLKPSTRLEKGDQISTIIKSLEEKFPLFSYLPYETKDYLLRYQAPFELEVKLKNPDANQEMVRQEIIDWIKSKEVDPSTHQIILVPLAP